MTAISNPREMEKIYDSVPRTEDVFNLNRQDLELVDELGAGNFGSVMRGVYKHKGMPIPVAVKTLKKDDMPTAEVSTKNTLWNFPWLDIQVTTLASK